MTSTLPTVPLYPVISFPDDPALPGLSMLFDSEWLWLTCQGEFGLADTVPEVINIRQFSHSQGRRALVSYVVDWPEEEYLPSEHFVARLERGKAIELFQFPNDDRLPGLKEAANPEGAVRLLNKYVLGIGARRARVEVIRYRPGSRAVLRHRVGRAAFYAKVIRPDRLPSFLGAWDMVGGSSFIAPRIAGHWNEGGVTWMSEIPGENLRRCIRRGCQPDPEQLFRGLESLWASDGSGDSGTAFDLPGAYRMALSALRHAGQDFPEISNKINEIASALDPFVESWLPGPLAHNDFYDDQLMVTPDGRMALVDFEEIGPGDPLLDVGNFLAHLSWASVFGREKSRVAAGEYYEVLLRAALDRYRWDRRELALREAVCLFRISTNTVRQIREDWSTRLSSALSLVSGKLE